MSAAVVLNDRITGFQICLQHDLRCYTIAASFPLLARQACGLEVLFGIESGKTFVKENDGTARNVAQPFAEGAGKPGLLPFPAIEMGRQADHDLDDLLFLNQSAEKAGILLFAAARIGLKRRGKAALRIADGQAHSDFAVIDAQQSARSGHRYLSRPFFLSSSTICLMPASSRRSATKTALPS